MSNPQFEAQWEYKEGGGQDDNPYPQGSQERLEWSLAMQKCQQEELQQLQRGFS